MDPTLNTLLREPKTVTVGSRAYALKPFGVLAVPVMSRLVGDVWGDVMRRPDLLANKDALIGWLMARLPEMIETKIEDLLQLLSMQTGESRDALVALPLDDFLELAQAGLEDGQDFFTRRILPKLKAAMDAHGIGRTSSPPSSPPVTAATTSSGTP
ncbi:MAG: hypothetical protein ROZ09_11685 [Thiobacillus sp.]|jgi:hypothetical protein|uniref:hypothetical protein n=1 Tax=Thiobacillus sp. TaxID=924 RepID=UPI002893C111|nr:hypothetical protein [Thiobacillus sp.]MDT3707481.1 hypothetical protein [Thiobacillus sp.]